MTYELAKDLNEAGFRTTSRTFINPDGTTYDWMDLKVGGERLPTISELIEACGGRLHSLRRGSWRGRGSWVASEDEYVEAGVAVPREPVGVGDTPEEAVARLWLALNKKEYVSD